MSALYILLGGAAAAGGRYIPENHVFEKKKKKKRRDAPSRLSVVCVRPSSRHKKKKGSHLGVSTIVQRKKTATPVCRHQKRYLTTHTAKCKHDTCFFNNSVYNAFVSSYTHKTQLLLEDTAAEPPQAMHEKPKSTVTRLL